MLSGPCRASVTLAGHQWAPAFKDVTARVMKWDSSTPSAHATSASPLILREQPLGRERLEQLANLSPEHCTPFLIARPGKEMRSYSGFLG